MGRWGIARLLVPWGIAVASLSACRGSTPPVLPPIPPGSGLVLVSSGPAPEVRDGQVVIDRVVAVVNNYVILMSELQEAIAIAQQESREPPAGSDRIDEMQRTMLNSMINHRLQVQEAQREKIEIPEEDVRGMVDDFVRRNGGDRAEVEARLRAYGLTWEALRREFRDQLLAQRIRSRRVGRRATVTEAEVDAYVAENRAKLEAGLKYRARHIVVLPEPPDQPAAWDRARAAIEAIASELRAGADFATLARERSRDASAASGGDLGWLSRGELEPAFETPLLDLPKGGVTPPVRTASGYHLFLLEDREELTPQMLAEARQQARDLLLQRKAQERFDEWVERLRRRALIAIRL
jgi:peptidyl-prolyl cis-trans isomerase SurA